MLAARSIALLLFAFSLVAVVPPAHASWPDDRYIDLGRVGTFGIADAFLTPSSQPGQWFSCFYSQGNGAWNVQRFGVDGIPSWPGGGIPLVGEGGSDHHLHTGTAYVPDGQGRLLHAFATSAQGGLALRVQRLDVDGTLVPPPGQYPTAWRLDTLVSPTSALPAGAADGAGGMYVVWYRAGVRMARVDANGARLDPWPDRGWRIASGSASSSISSPPGVALDGSGGLLVLWANDSIRVQRVNADTSRAAGWPAAGLALAPGLGFVVDGAFTLMPSGPSHMVALWSDWNNFEGTAARRLMAQRFSLAGTRDPAWPTDGVVLDTMVQNAEWYDHRVHCMSDGDGGVLAGWQSADSYKLGGVRSDGTRVPSQVALTRSEIYGSWYGPIAVGMAAGRSGGVALFWRGGGVRGRWYDRDLQPDPSPALAEVEVRSVDEMAATPFMPIRVRAARSDESGGAYLICEGVAPSSLDDIGSGFLMHVSQRGVVGAAPREASFDLSRPAPNPARRGDGVSLRFAVPHAGHVRVQVLDVAGRVVRTLLDAGTSSAYSAVESGGELAIRWDGSDARGHAVTPGLYFVRAELDGRAAVQRVALVE